MEHKSTRAALLNTADQSDASCSHTAHFPSRTLNNRKQKTLNVSYNFYVLLSKKMYNFKVKAFYILCICYLNETPPLVLSP